MLKIYNINYEFDKGEIFKSIDEHIYQNIPNYICVADGVVLSCVNNDEEYKHIVNAGMFSICDSGFVPLYIKWIYNRKYQQYCGSDIFLDIINQKKYKMFFLGSYNDTLQRLKTKLTLIDSKIDSMSFMELPFCNAEDFNYVDIASVINNNGADIIWIGLGAPKQEIFMNNLRKHLNSGVMIAVGAVFNFYSENGMGRAPKWMINTHLEFIYRIVIEPRKQIKRCAKIISTLPGILYREVKSSKYR